MRLFKGLIILTICSLTACSSNNHSADAILIHNVKGYTFSNTADKHTLHAFEAMLFENGKILATGRKEELLKEKPDAQLYDGQQAALLPGLTDAHGHILSLGENLSQVELRGIKSLQETLDTVKQFSATHKNNPWLLGRGWNQVLWETKSFPTAIHLDSVTRDQAIWLSRVDGHAGWANSKTLRLAGIDKNTPDPEGGMIMRDSEGNPTGILIDAAMSLVEHIIPTATAEQNEQALFKSLAHLHALGITGVHDAGINFETYKLYKKLANEERLPLRVYAMLSANDQHLDRMLQAGTVHSIDDSLSIRSVKIYADGALGSRGAALLAPYADAAEHQGLLLTPTETLQTLFPKIITAGFQINIHAIGDNGNRIALDQFEAAFKIVGDQNLRHRIEHAQVVALEDIPRFKSLNIIPSMQPTHATSDMNMAGDRIGSERLKGAYAWRRFLDQGSMIASGSDFPVELANPFLGLHAAVTRQDTNNNPQDGWLPKQKMTIIEALRSFTLDAAYAAHQEDILGSLEKGKWADFILVDQDILQASPQDIWKTKVLETWIAGKPVFKKSGSPK